MNKKGAMSDLFVFMIFSLVIVLVCGIFIYLGGKVSTEVHSALDGKTAGADNMTTIINNTFDAVNTTYQSLYWISWFLMVGMIVSIFISSYLVTTKPVFFVPYIFLTIIAVIVSVGISNAYEEIIQTPTLANTFAGFIGANFIMLQLPIWISVIGIGGAIIMFTRMGSKENDIYGGSTGYG